MVKEQVGDGTAEIIANRLRVRFQPGLNECFGGFGVQIVDHARADAIGVDKNNQVVSFQFRSGLLQAYPAALVTALQTHLSGHIAHLTPFDGLVAMRDGQRAQGAPIGPFGFGILVGPGHRHRRKFLVHQRVDAAHGRLSLAGADRALRPEQAAFAHQRVQLH